MDILTAFHSVISCSTCDWCRKICSYNEPLMPVRVEKSIYFICTYCKEVSNEY